MSTEERGWRAHLAAWAQLARISNLPTTITNVLVGMSIAGASWESDWGVMLAVMGAVALLYIGGMIFNDVCDHEIDAVERPSRPIPSGRISRNRAKKMVVTCMFAAIVILMLAGGGPALISGLGLVAVIVAYDVVHQRTGASVILMGLCRGMVYIVASSAVAWPLVDIGMLATAAGVMTVFTVLLSWVARYEVQQDAMPGHTRVVAWLIPIIVLVPICAVAMSRVVNPATMVLSALLVVGWLTRSAIMVSQRPARPVHAVMGWLAGMCLIDMMVLAALDRPFDAMFAFIMFLLTIRGHRRILGS